MTANERLERYLRAEMERLRLSRRPAESAAKPRPFVTISRQAGAGGHSLADVMLGVFEQQPDRDTFSGWQIVDHNIRDMGATLTHRGKSRMARRIQEGDFLTR